MADVDITLNFQLIDYLKTNSLPDTLEESEKEKMIELAKDFTYVNNRLVY